jgi:PhnB protein
MPTIVTPYLRVKGAAAALEFYAKAFGATEEMRLVQQDGRIGHAQIRIGDARVMLADEYPECDAVGPQTLGGTTVGISLELDAVDAFVERAGDAGATVLVAPRDEFYGERSAKLRDPFGHEWHVSTKIEDVPVDEMQRRFDAITTT